MIVRTYGRRSRGIQRTLSDPSDEDVNDAFEDPMSQESGRDQLYRITLSSQESTSQWSAFDSDRYGHNSSQDSFLARPSGSSFGVSVNGDGRKSNKRARVGKRGLGVPKSSRPSLLATSTLMEAQEFGEMMEHVDEVNFALDGLRKGQPVRIRRASLLSLLSICGTAQQRRLLRTQGLAKTIIDAVLGLSFDDSPSNLAAATLFYALAVDGQDDHILESPSSVRFLIKLLKPVASTAVEEKAPGIGCKLLGLRKDSDISRDTSKRFDSSAAAIAARVEEILLNCKELKPVCGNNNTERPELCPKWVALLILEKACLSKISLEETSGAMRKTGGDFKEKLREHGGLDAVFEVAKESHYDMEGWMQDTSFSASTSRPEMNLQRLSLLLKCLKIMENATFLSKDNQSHLLRMKGKWNNPGSPISFAELIISIIRILSNIYLMRCSSSTSNNGKSICISDCGGEVSELALIKDCRVDSNKILSTASLKNCCGTKKSLSNNNFKMPHNSRQLSSITLDNSVLNSEMTNISLAETNSLKIRLSSSTSGSCSGTSRNSSAGAATGINFFGSSDSGKSSHFTEGPKARFPDESGDPFEFDEDDFEPSKWDLLSGKQKISQSRKSTLKHREHENFCQPQLVMSHSEFINGESSQSDEISSSTASDEECLSLVSDCLLTGVKVLMNLTNENSVGCRKIALCGGLETMALLIASHFPTFSSTLCSTSDMKEDTSSRELDRKNDKHLTDQELDFLVAILGLLVNLVEKDSNNRSRLAAASVSLPNLQGVDESPADVIPLLCSIFLSNKGAGEGVEEGQALPWDDEAAMLEGEKEAEKMIVEAYAALLLAFLSTESKEIRDAIADCLPGRKLAVLVPVLERFVAFHLTLNMISPETHKAVSEVIESCRIP